MCSVALRVVAAAAAAPTEAAFLVSCYCSADMRVVAVAAPHHGSTHTLLLLLVLMLVLLVAQCTHISIGWNVVITYIPWEFHVECIKSNVRQGHVISIRFVLLFNITYLYVAT
jgi:hypothetical protein